MDIKTGDNKRTFETGAQRDTVTGKGRYDLISPIFEDRLAKHLENGANHYGDRNWEKGMPTNTLVDSLQRHLRQIKEGDLTEDHEAGIACNIMFLIHTREMIRRGLLPSGLETIPDYMEELEIIPIGDDFDDVGVHDHMGIPPWIDLNFTKEKDPNIELGDRVIGPDDMPYRYVKMMVKPQKTITAYLSHPIRGIKGSAATDEDMADNNRRAIAICDDLRRYFPRLDIYCPAEHDEALAHLLKCGDITIEELLGADKYILEQRDLLLVYDHEECISSGMDVEWNHAGDCGIPIFYFNNLTKEKILLLGALLEGL